MSTPLILTNRLYRYIKSSAIVGIVQAGVELVTNSDDAYRKSELTAPFRFDIVVDYKNKELIVYDQAIGLTGDGMISSFGQVGDYTSDMIARGYFSRGAKDITAIGHATFVAIKDGKISEVSISTTDMFTVIRKDDDVTQEDRDTYGIVENGLWSKLQVKDSITFPSYERMSEINKYFSMRDIFGNEDNHINIKVIHETGATIHDARLQYKQPAIKETLIDEEIVVDGYPDIKATFKLYLFEEPVPEAEYISYTENGIIVSSGNALHEVSTFYGDIRNHPYIRHICGRLECSHINKLMYDFDANPDDVNNPFPIIDHSRINGLDRAHPFTKALFRIPHKQLKYVLQDLYENGFEDSEFSESLSSLFKNVELFGTSFFKEMIEEIYSYKPADKTILEGYLTRRAKNVVSSSEESTYNFQDSETFISKGTGNIENTEPSLNIIFTNKDYLTFPYYIYRIDNKIYLEINIQDFLISKYIKKDVDTGNIRILDKSAASVLLIDIISEALARESIKEKGGTTRDESQFSNKNPDEVFGELEKLKALLTPKLYQIIVTDDMSGLNIV